MMRRTKRLLLMGALLAVGGAVVGLAYATIPSGGVINGCYLKTGGTLRVIDAGQSCKSNETSLNWSVQGPSGATGAAGATGASGTPGASATKLFALRAIDESIQQQSGGITATLAVSNQPIPGYSQVTFTFPQDLSNCVAIAGNSNTNDGTTALGGIDDHALTTSISGTTVRVYRPTPSAGVFPAFAIAVFC